MTDAHCHVSCGDASVREFLIGRDFFGSHPWDVSGDQLNLDRLIDDLREQLLAHSNAGVGEIGLDRLRTKTVPQTMRTAFETQLRLAAEMRRPVVLHGAKCWGQVVDTIRRIAPAGVPSFLFHGFSRSDGLLPDIAALNGYISISPAILNDHAVNYRELAKRIPIERLLVETDRTEENAAICPSVADVLTKLAEVRNEPLSALSARLDENADRFISF